MSTFPSLSNLGGLYGLRVESQSDFQSLSNLGGLYGLRAGAASSFPSLSDLGGLYGFGAGAEEGRKLAAWNNTSSYFGSETSHVDCDGRIIKWSEYGQFTDHGWQVDHIVAQALGGGDHPSNLRARHWRGNSRAGGILGDFLDRVR